MTKTLWSMYLNWMLMLLIIMMIMNSIIHPVLMISLMLMYNCIICMNMKLMKSNPMFPIMFFMIMISGLMIIFLYFSSLVSNEKTLNSMKKSTIITLSMNLMYMILISNLPNKLNYSNMIQSYTYSMNLLFYKKMPSITLLYHKPFINMTMMCMLFLLITLITVIKTCVPKIKTMRKIN